MYLRKLFLFSVSLLLLASLFPQVAMSADQKSVVTVVEGKVMCFDIPEGMSPAQLATGVLKEKITDYVAKVELTRGKMVTAYIPYNQRYAIYDQLQSGAGVLLQKNSRRIYQTEWDIISCGKMTQAGMEYSEGEIKPVDPKEVAKLTEIADKMKEERKSEEGKTIEKDKGDVVKEILETKGVVAKEKVEGKVERKVEEKVEVKVEEKAEIKPKEKVEEKVSAKVEEKGEEEVSRIVLVEPVETEEQVNNQEDTLGIGSGPVIDEQVEEEEEKNEPSNNPPPEPTPPPAPSDGGTTTISHVVNPSTTTATTFTVGGTTYNIGVGSDATGDGSTDHPWQTIEYALTQITDGTIYVTGTDTVESFPITVNARTNVIIRGGDTNVTIDANNTARVFEITGGSTGIELRYLTITRGAGVDGAGVYIDNSSVTIANCTIDSNIATGNGGGIYVGSETTTGVTIGTFIQDSTISSNQAGAAGSGGGLYKTGAGMITATTSTFSSNSGVSSGGGVAIVSFTGAVASFTRCRFTSNTASTSGAGASFDNVLGISGFTNCLFAQNGSSSTAVEGPGAWCNLSLIPLFINCTFASNMHSMGALSGAIHNQGAVGPGVTNCLFESNSGWGVYCDTVTTENVAHSSFNNNPSGTFINITDNGGNITSDPLLKNLAGGDYHIGAGSPCIDAGSTDVSLTEDLDGRSRSGRMDIGCYEYVAGDPPITGNVYDSVTGENISSPVVGIYRKGSTTSLSTTTDNPFTFNVDPGDYYIAVSKSGYAFPSQIVSQVTSGDHGDIFTAGNDALTINIPMDSDGYLYVEKTVNKKRVSLGEIITYNIKIQNKHWFKSVENVELIDEIVNGFKYVSGSAYVGSTKQDDPTISSRKAIFNLGTISANSTRNLSYQVRVGMGIPDGRYKAAANTRKSTTQERNSNISSASIEVIEDPLFRKGTIIGKVFNDINRNGWQDSGEKGIPNVTLVTEYGVVVKTDSDGKYHIADVSSGNHLVKVDQATLPEGAKFTTDNPYFVKMTEGLLAKANFGITQMNTDEKTQINADKNKFFIVGLAEGIVRNLSTSKNIEMVDKKDKRFDSGIRVDGRLALYLKGKVLGKFLITASVDTERRPYGRYDTKELFKNLDPDKYYPIYGDASQVDYSGVNTQDVVYVLIEWDESFAKWGSFHTEFPLYNRSLSGGIINYQSVGKTKFGDPWTIVKGFGAISRQKPAHDEFVGTGGSLYYLRHQDVIMGSEKLRVETRDRIGKTTISSFPLCEEKDYEIDYDTGRILLRRPLNSIQQGYTSTIISNDILMGERVYLVIDYEYYNSDLSDNNWGARASQQLGHNIRVGGTYVQEERTGDDYKIYGGDATVKLNKDTEVNGRYSHSEETQLGSTVSYDGGLSFQEQFDTFSDGKDGDAYGVDGRTKLFNNTDLFLSYNKQDPYYSATDSISQQGSEKYIGGISSRLTDNLTVGLNHITQKYDKETTFTDIFADRNVHTTTAILDYQKSKWDLRGEYQHQSVKHPLTDYTYFGMLPLLNNDFIAGRIGYQLFDWLHPYVRGQGTVSGEANNQGTVGADIVIWKKTSLNIAETVGNKGNSTLVGLTSKVTEGTDVYANLEVGNHMQLGKFTKTTYGQSSMIDKTSRAYVEEDYSSYRENLVRGSLLGYDKKLTDNLALGVTYERSDLKNETNIIDRDAGSIKLAYLHPDWLDAKTKLELRNDRGTNEVRQWVTQNDILWRATESLSLSGRGNWGWSDDRRNEVDLAEFYELGAGFGFRPVSWDRLNLLGKYSYLMNQPPDSQWDFIEDMKSHRNVYGLEGAFDLFRYLQLVGKFAYRDLAEKVGYRDWTKSDTYLYIGRANFHIMNAEENKPFMLRGWDLGVEYRVLRNDQIEDKKDGFLVELDKDIGNYLRMGVGYNFTDYDDDLRNDDKWDAKGWFVRVNGKY